MSPFVVPFVVGVKGEELVFVNPPLPGQPFSKRQALDLAARLVALADDTGEEFQKVLQEFLGS